VEGERGEEVFWVVWSRMASSPVERKCSIAVDMRCWRQAGVACTCCSRLLNLTMMCANIVSHLIVLSVSHVRD